MAELAATIITLLATAKTIANGVALIAAIKDSPKEIANLEKEHNSLSAALESLGRLIDAAQLGDGLHISFTEQVRNVVGDTERTLKDLHLAIIDLQPSKLFGPGKRGALHVRFKYLTRERTLQAIQARISARRDALTLLLNMWASADTREMKKQLSQIQSGLESCLASIRSGPADTGSDSGTPTVSEHSIASGNWRDCSSTGSNHGAVETEPSMDDETPSVSNLARRFDRALQTARQTDPRSEVIQQRARRLQSAQAATIGSAMISSSGSLNATSSKGKGKHTTQVRELVSKEACAPGLWSKESAVAAQALAKAYREAEDFESALEYLHLALVAREALLGPTNLKTLEVLDLIAGILEIQNRKAEALEILQRSLDGRESNPSIGARHPTYGPAGIRMARLTAAAGDEDAAIGQLTKLLSLGDAQANGGTAHLAVQAEIAKLELKRGNLADGQRHADECIAKYRLQVARREANPRLGPSHRHTQEARDALVALETAKTESQRPVPPFPTPGPMQDGEEMWIEELRQYEERLAEMRDKQGDSPQTLELMCNLADAYASHEQYEAAIGWYLEAIKGMETRFGAEHPTTLSALHNLGVCYADHEDFASALKHLDQALKGRERRLPKDHPDTFSTITQLSMVHQALDDSAKSLVMINDVVRGLTEKYRDPANPVVVSAEFNRGKILRKMGSLAMAKESFESVLRYRLLTMDPRHPLIIAPKVQLGLVLRDQNELPDAVVILEDAHDGQKAIFGAHTPNTINTAHELASCYWSLDRYADALKYYLVVLDGLTNGHEPADTSTTVIMTNIGTCHVAMEDRSEALVWFEKVLRIYERELGKDSAKTIGAVLRVAHQLFALGRFENAIEHYFHVLAVREKTMPDTGEEMMLVLFQLFRATNASCHSEKALKWGKRFLNLDEHADLERRVIVMHETGKIHAARKDYTEALEMYHKALSDAKFLDTNHGLPSHIVHDIQIAMRDMDDGILTMERLQRQRERFSQVLATDARFGVRLLCQLGHIHARHDMHQEALNILEEARDAIQCMPDMDKYVEVKHEAMYGIAKAHLKLYNNAAALTYLQMLIDSAEHEHYRSSAMIDKACVLEKECDVAGAIDVWKLIRREKGREAGLDDLEVLFAARRIGSLYVRLDNSTEGEKWVQNAVAGFKRSHEPEARLHEATTKEIMTSIFLERGDLQGALDNQLACTVALEREVGFDDERTASAASDLAGIYQILGQEQAALQWYRKAVATWRSKIGDRSSKAIKAEQAIRALERSVEVTEMT